MRFPPPLAVQFRWLFVIVALCGTALQPLRAQTRFTLRQTIEQALQNNLNLQLGANQVAVARENLELAQRAYAPSVSGTVDFQRQFGTSFDFLSFQRVTNATTFSSPRLQLSYDLFAGFSRYYRLQQSRHNLSAQGAALQNARDNLLTNVLTQYLQLTLSAADAAVARTRLATLERQLARTRLQVAGGIATELQLRNLEGQMALEQVNVLTAQNNIDRAGLALAQLLQLPADAEYEFLVPDSVPDAQLQAPLLTPAEVLAHALGNMASVRQADLQTRVADFQARAARSALFPRLSVAAGLSSNFTSNGGQYAVMQVPFVIGFNGQVFPLTDANGIPLTQTVRTGRTRTGYFEQIEDNFAQFVTLQLAIPILNGWQARQNYEVARINQSTAAINGQIARNDLLRLVEQAYLDATAAQARHAALQTQMSAFQEAFRLTEAQFEAGVVTFFEYNEALDNLTRANLQNRQAMYELLFRRMILEYYAGREISF